MQGVELVKDENGGDRTPAPETTPAPLRGDQEARPAHRPRGPLQQRAAHRPAARRRQGRHRGGAADPRRVVRRARSIETQCPPSFLEGLPAERVEKRAARQEAADDGGRGARSRPSAASTAPTRPAPGVPDRASTSRPSSRASPAATCAAARGPSSSRTSSAIRARGCARSRCSAWAPASTTAWHGEAHRHRAAAALRDRDGDARGPGLAAGRARARGGGQARRVRRRGAGVARVRGVPGARGAPGDGASRSARCPGGLNTTGVAPYKLHAEDALREVDWVRSLGVEIRTGRRGRARRDAASSSWRSTTRCSWGSAWATTRSSASRARTARASSGRRRGSSR